MRRLQFGFRVWLLLLALFPAVPIMAFSVVTLYRLADVQHTRAADELTRRTEAVAIAVGQRLEGLLAVLQALAETDVARRGDIEGLYAHAQRLLPHNPLLLNFNLTTEDGHQVFNTLKPFGETLPPTNLPEAPRAVFATGRPFFGGPFLGAVSNQQMMALAVPVMVDGKVAWSLRANMTTEVFMKVLAEQHLFRSWAVALLHSAGRVIADTGLIGAGLGAPVPPALLTAMVDESAEPPELDAPGGVRRRVAVARVPSRAMAVAIGAPAETLDADFHASLGEMTLGGGLLVALGLAAAARLSRDVARKVATVSAASSALGRNAAMVVPATNIRELDELGSAIGAAKEREVHAAAELFDQKANEQRLAAAHAALETTARERNRSHPPPTAAAN